MRIVMTGGGTAGHVTPNMAIIPGLRKLDFDIQYIGTKDGMERGLIEREGIPYHSITAGKLRRYLDVKNATDIFRVGKGFFQALCVIRRLKPDVVFSKGGFVSCPVVWAAWINRIPVVIHESDYTPGLANKLSMPFADTICYTFPETAKHLKEGKGILTGIPVRESLLHGQAAEGRNLCGFNSAKPVIVVIGGSQGSEFLNTIIRKCINTLLKDYQVCHICGKGGIDSSLKELKGYRQFEYVNEELPHLFAMADMVIARAGATTLFELLALGKPNLLIPLSRQASRGDQILNAGSFKKQGFSTVLMEEDLNEQSFVQAISSTMSDREASVKAMKASSGRNGTEEVIKVITNVLKFAPKRK